MKKKLICILATLMLASINSLNAQVSYGGLPNSFSHPNEKSLIEPIEIAANYDSINSFLNSRCTEGCRLHVGCDIPTSLHENMEKGRWLEEKNGTFTYLVTYHLKDAKAIGVSFSEIHLKNDECMFIYNSSKSSVYGSYNENNILEDGSFSIEPVDGEYITIEFNNLPSKEISYRISSFSYFFDYSIIKLGFGSSGDCQVNINCQEGLNMRNSANAVMKILVLDSGGWYYCTGSLVNNTLLDKTPYFLTADHCAHSASSYELEKMIFYFLYESEGCENPEQEPAHKTLIGCKKLASSPYYSASAGVGPDFFLVKLLQDTIPEEYSPNFAGWDISEEPAEYADCIHHPSGDIKKISHTETITSNCFFIENHHIETHWKVIWSATQSGHGVTEGGSSGSPLFNPQQQIVGVLSGGKSSCSELEGPDYFGKLSYAWDKCGSENSKRLDCWLDPNNSGTTKLNGYSDIATIEKLNVTLNNSTINSLPNITIGDRLCFSATFSHHVDSCIWTFNGGIPSSVKATSTDIIEVEYKTFGKYDVKVEWFVAGKSYSRTYDKFVNVKASIYPNPFVNNVTFILGDNVEIENAVIMLLSSDGKQVASPTQVDIIDNTIKAHFPIIPDGSYILYTVFNGLTDTYHVVKRKTY